MPRQKLERFDRLLSSYLVKKSTGRESGGTGDIVTMKTSSTPPGLAYSCSPFFLFAPREKWPRERRKLRAPVVGREKERMEMERERASCVYFQSC